MIWPAFFKKKKSSAPAVPALTGVVFVLFIMLFAAAATIAFVFGFSGYYQGKVFPKTFVGDLDLGGLTYAAARSLLEDRTNRLTDQGFVFEYENERFTIESTLDDPANPDLSAHIFYYNVDETIDRIERANLGRSEAERIFYWLRGWTAVPVLEIDEAKLTAAIQAEVSEYEQPAVSAALVIDQEYNLSITAEKGGQAFDYGKIVTAARKKLESLDSSPLSIALEPDYPKITRTAAEPLLTLAGQALAGAPYSLVYEDKAWEITKEQVRDWLVFTDDEQPGIGFDREKMAEYLAGIAGEINVEVQEAKFAMADGKVTEFQPSRNGRTLMIEDSLSEINAEIRQVGIKEISLVVKEIEPTVATEEVNDMGIRELVGEGRSNFRGSPKNRQHNIAVGAETLNGILIKPNEEFSLVGALGKIEAATGYLPELVIKGNRTIPEYGGGLCQIGTTAFRLAINAGLPITERKSHSYRVSYYEPAGTDATIYDPSPDVKFINDTGNYLLLTTAIEGTELIFRFYGTPDGRRVSSTEPRIYNLVRPAPTKLVETTDLAPGQKKCTESAHTGADAEFTRTITYADGQQKTEVFTSHYKPWQEVCLIGVEELSAPAE